MMYKILVDNVWVQGAPIDGALCRLYINGEDSAYSEFKYSENSANKIVVKSHNRRALIQAGGQLTVTVEIQDSAGTKLPVNDTFALPVGRAGGGNYRTLLMNFVDGECVATHTWPDAGEFEITESMVNMHLNEEDKLSFGGFYISVGEASL